MESLILAQNERWRRVLSMQVERQPDQLSSQQEKTQEEHHTKARDSVGKHFPYLFHTKAQRHKGRIK